MPGWLKEWWPIIALALGAGVFPLVRWCVGQIRKGLVGHDELIAALKAQDGKLKEHVDAHVGVHAELERRSAEESRLSQEWRHAHDVHHARVEAMLAGLPTSDAVQQVLRQLMEMRVEMRERMTALEGGINETDTRIDGLRDLIDRVGNTVERHDQIISEAALAARHKGG